MRTFRLVLGILFLALATASVSEYLFFNQGLPPEKLKAEEIVLGQFWSFATPILVILGLTLIFWARLRDRFGNAARRNYP